MVLNFGLLKSRDEDSYQERWQQSISNIKNVSKDTVGDEIIHTPATGKTMYVKSIYIESENPA